MLQFPKKSSSYRSMQQQMITRYSLCRQVQSEQPVVWWLFWNILWGCRDMFSLRKGKWFDSNNAAVCKDAAPFITNHIWHCSTSLKDKNGFFWWDLSTNSYSRGCSFGKVSLGTKSLKEIIELELKDINWDYKVYKTMIFFKSFCFDLTSKNTDQI